MSTTRIALVSLLLFSCTERQPEPAARIDHVIVGVSNLEEGMNEIQRLTGVRPAIGGAHPGGGTQNALLSLGDNSYLEILAPNPAEQVASAEVEELRSLKQPTPIGWAVSTSDIGALRSTLNSNGLSLTPVEPGSRRKPDGSVLKWVTFGFASLDHPFAPFFIVWNNPSLHPSRTSPSGCTLQSLHIADPAADRLRGGVGPLGVKVSVTEGHQSRMKLDLSCPRGGVTFG